jgi:hypothetical protein
MITRSVFILQVRVFTFSLTLPLQAFLLPLEEHLLLPQTCLNHLNVSYSVIHSFSLHLSIILVKVINGMGHAVAQVVEALCYKL